VASLTQASNTVDLLVHHDPIIKLRQCRSSAVVDRSQSVRLKLSRYR
jgi:hypothetical protein